jgi:glycerophosphoryl diester phosphodiesterase
VWGRQDHPPHTVRGEIIATQRMPHLLLDLSARPVIGHRGAAAHAPENTLPSFRLGIEQGAEAVEFDVRVTADGVPVVLHDPTLDRTTNLTGAVSALTLQRVREADAGWRYTPDRGRTFPWRGKGIQVPTLADVVAEIRDVPLLIEIKTPAASGAVMRVLNEAGATTRSVVASAHMAALEPFRAPPFIVGASAPESTHLFRSALLGRPSAPVRYHALFLPYRRWGLTIPTARFVGAARRLGCPMHVWTVNDAALARRFWSVGVCGIVTDSPAVIRTARDAA